MNVSATIEANAKTAEVMEPRMRPFDDPAEFTQTTAMFSSTLCDHRFDATITQALTVRLGVVTAIGVDDFGLAKRSTACAANRWNRIDLCYGRPVFSWLVRRTY